MPTKLQQDAIELYSALMTEIKFRTGCIDDALNGKMRIPPMLVREFCFLQLRMNCELIALSCLVAHGDIEATEQARFQRSFSAGEILAGLDKLHPNFFPRPMTQRDTKTNPDNTKNYSLLEKEQDYMTKQELITLYGRHCGDALHKGSLRNLLASNLSVQVNFDEIAAITQRMMNLLSIHVINLAVGDTVLVCMLSIENLPHAWAGIAGEALE